MAVQSTLDIVNYYPGLLVKQYATKPKAVATIEASVTPIIMPQTSVQEIVFDTVPASGSFVLSYGGAGTPMTVNWNDSAAIIQAKLRSLPPDTLDGGSATSAFAGIVTGGGAATTVFQDIMKGGDASGFGFDLSEVTVTGSLAGQLLTVTFVGVTPPAALLEVVSSALLDSGGQPVGITITETDLTLPLAVQNGYNLIGQKTAVGKQLDVLGKYVGAVRSVVTFTAAITLDDSDYLQLIRMAIVKNNAGSALAVIETMLATFFGSQIAVFDYQNMHMSFLINDALGSEDLVQAFVAEGFLPKPLGVQASVAYVPDMTVLFGYRTYKAAAVNSTPYNSYSNYNTNWKWLSYKDAVVG